MQGRPVWLASVSKRNRQGIIPNTRWGAYHRREAVDLLKTVLDGVGDPDRGWRLFRMQITYCMHLACSVSEIELLPDEWETIKGSALAGGPVEILDSGHCATTPSVMPCERPAKGRIPTPSFDADVWIPLDCGLCPPCLDRISIKAGLDALLHG